MRCPSNSYFVFLSAKRLWEHSGTSNYLFEHFIYLDPLNHTTTFGYDATGNLTTIIDPLNKTTT